MLNCLKIVTLAAICVALNQLQVAESTDRSVQQLPQRIYGLLNELSCGLELNASAKFALLLAEFLIKREPNELCDK